jgi:hypothetical protein
MPRGITARVYPKVMLPVTRHRALWCSDFPPPPRLPEEEAILRPSKIEKEYTAKSANLKLLCNRGVNGLVHLDKVI